MSVYIFDDYPSPPEGTDTMLANARLIAAAPDMFEALQEAEKHFGPFSEITINGQHDPDDVRVVAMIRDALAKALGHPVEAEK